MIVEIWHDEMRIDYWHLDLVTAHPHINDLIKRNGIWYKVTSVVFDRDQHRIKVIVTI